MKNSYADDYADNYAADFTEDLGWISYRLSTVKRNTDPWKQLAAALQATVDSVIEPTLIRLTNMRSLFTATDEDLETIESDFGDFFKVDRELTGKDKAMGIMAKQDDINYKSTLAPISDMFSRKFKNLTVEWSPLYAIAAMGDNYAESYAENYADDYTDGYTYATPYGSKLLTQEQITDFHLDINDFFLTSRGTVSIDIRDVLAGGYTVTEFLTELREGIEKLRPVHIVFDSNGLFLLYEIVDPPNVITLAAREPVRTFPAFVDTLDLNYDKTVTTRTFGAVAAPVWDKEEYFRLDELPADTWPMDTPLTMYGETY